MTSLLDLIRQAKGHLGRYICAPYVHLVIDCLDNMEKYIFLEKPMFVKYKSYVFLSKKKIGYMISQETACYRAQNDDLKKQLSASRSTSKDALISTLTEEVKRLKKDNEYFSDKLMELSKLDKEFTADKESAKKIKIITDRLDSLENEYGKCLDENLKLKKMNEDMKKALAEIGGEKIELKEMIANLQSQNRELLEKNKVLLEINNLYKTKQELTPESPEIKQILSQNAKLMARMREILQNEDKSTDLGLEFTRLKEKLKDIEEGLKNFVSDPLDDDPDFEKCPICFCNYKNLVQISSCAHKICEDCHKDDDVQKLNECPSCRKEITSYTSTLWTSPEWKKKFPDGQTHHRRR
jgi:DNA repair exonuclease SbcCD ATPase subunit